MSKAVDISRLQSFGNEANLSTFIAANYMTKIKNFFSDDKKALKFLSGMSAAVQRNPKLIECTPMSVVNSFMMMAQLELMPSDVSGEAYVIPYDNSKKIDGQWVKVKEAQFQIGYQGLITLMYRAGAKEIVTEIVRKNDGFTYINGVIHHEVDPFSNNRGEAIGVYAIIKLSTGGSVTKALSKKEVLEIASKFSKSFSGDKSPWTETNDPQLWMWRKTALKQCNKMAPKDERLVQAIALDNQDSVISDRLGPAQEETKSLAMGNLLVQPYENQDNQGEDHQDTTSSDEGEGTINIT